MTDDRFYFRQLLAGRDFAREDPVARQMVNFVYLIGDRETGEAVAVDPAYAPGELVEILGADGMRLTEARVPTTSWNSLSVKPGQTAVTRTLYGYPSSASASENFTRHALLAA